MSWGGWGGGGGWGHGHGMDSDDALGAAYDHQVVSRLAGYTRPQRKLVLLALIATVIYSISHSLGPRIIGIAIDDFIDKGDMVGLTTITAIFIANGALTWVTQYGQTLALAWVGQSILHDLRTEMFAHLQKLSLSFFNDNEVGRLMSRVQNDVLALQELLTAGFFNVLQDILSLGIVFYLLFSLNFQLALITFSVVPLLLGAMLIWQRLARVAYMRVREAIAIVNAGLQENISGVRVIQSLTREDRNAEEFEHINNNHFMANVRAGRLAAAVQPLVEMLAAVATALVIIFGGRLVLAGEMGVGELVTFTLYITRFFEPIRELTLQYTQFQRAMVGGVRIFEVLDSKITVQDAPDATELPTIKGQIDFNHVDFHYLPNVPVLNDLDLHIRPGETLALVGATGAGKTTIINLLTRFYDISNGSITIDGHDLRDVTQGSLRRQIGLVLQDPFLFTGSVRENIRFGRLEATDAEVEEAARVVGAHDFLARLEHGYDTVLHERGGNLSVGQRQLMSFARAVLADPKVLLLDEATANVDTHSEMIIQRALKQLLEGRTSIVIAHRLSTVRDADRIVVLERGRIAEQGNHAQLMASGGMYARLYTMSYATVGSKDVLLEDEPESSAQRTA